MAEYRDLFDQFQAAGAGVAAVSVDAPAQSEALRQMLRLEFPILCDTQRRLIADWNVLNGRVRDGIARPAVFVIDRERRVRFRSIDAMAAQVPAAAVFAFVSSGMPGPGAGPPRRAIIPRVGDWVVAARGALGLRVGTPKS